MSKMPPLPGRRGTRRSLWKRAAAGLDELDLEPWVSLWSNHSGEESTTPLDWTGRNKMPPPRRLEGGEQGVPERPNPLRWRSSLGPNIELLKRHKASRDAGIITDEQFMEIYHGIINEGAHVHQVSLPSSNSSSSSSSSSSSPSSQFKPPTSGIQKNSHQLQKPSVTSLVSEDFGPDNKVLSIYTLELEGGYYYVGKSVNPEVRFEEHKNGNGSAWTKKHRPIRLLKVISDVSPFEEDKQVKELMTKYGIDRVRGGSYVQINLDPMQKEMLKKEIRGALDVCSRCGRAGHFVASCNAEKDTERKAVEKEVVHSPSCHRCGRTSHRARDCYASTHVDGYELSDTDDDEDDDYTYMKKPKLSGACHRCGRNSHWAQDCYASTHLDGYRL